jgi:hypothetical protein
VRRRRFIYSDLAIVFILTVTVAVAVPGAESWTRRQFAVGRSANGSGAVAAPGNGDAGERGPEWRGAGDAHE